MSNRMTAGELRREMLLRIIRHTVNGRGVNCRGGLSLNDDLKRLIAEGKVVISRIRGMGRSKLGTSKRPYRGIRGIHRLTVVQPADGVYTSGFIGCPCCGSHAPDAWLIKHANNCSLRTDHWLENTGIRERHEHWYNKAWMGKPNRP